MKATSSSIHNLNADNGLNLPRKALWMLYNFANNNYFPKSRSRLDIRHFSPELSQHNWKKINLKSAPSRALSDLFWQKIDWKILGSELSEIHISDIGCGSGAFALRLQDFSGNLISSYCGFDSSPRKNWADLTSAHSFITLKKHNSNLLSPHIPKETNLLITQSAIEHFENDILFFEQINNFIKQTCGNIIQIHLFPSASCLKLNLFHGVRQYTHRTISRITGTFDSERSYSMLFELGGKNSNRLHYQFITKPLVTKKADWRNTKAEEYRKSLIKAIEQDINTSNGFPTFYALVIHSNFKERIFENMGSLGGTN